MSTIKEVDKITIANIETSIKDVSTSTLDPNAQHVGNTIGKRKRISSLTVQVNDQYIFALIQYSNCLSRCILFSVSQHILI